MRRLIALLLAMSLAACGFQLRGSYNLPWATLHLSLPPTDVLHALLKRNIEATTQTRIVASVKDAQASLVILRNEQAKNILSLSATGLVREFQLVKSFAYSIQDAAGKELVPPNQIVLTREMTFDDARLFAKEAEEQLIWREMQDDLVQQLLRRLAAAKPVASPAG